jgi:hypothetical protein
MGRIGQLKINWATTKGSQIEKNEPVTAGRHPKSLEIGSSIPIGTC